MTGPIHIAIVEDNHDNIETFQYVLSQLTMPVHLAGIARDETEAYAVLTNEAVELVFLDIQLRTTTIFSVLEKVYKEGHILPELVFLTAHGSFENAVKAIQFACLDFVTKPFDARDIENTMQRYLAKKQTSPPNQQPEIGLLLQLLKNDIHTPKSMAIQLSRGIIELVDLDQILYIEADENITIVHLADKPPLHSNKNFGHYLSLLADNLDFIQISKSYLVNVSHIRQYNHQDKSLKLKTGQTLIVSHRFSRELHKFLLSNQQQVLTEGKFDFIKNLFKSGSK
ncbi:MAG: response regulator transcription factor [Saprospiraceae bacterium]|nr:response regulator transcription factor [Saprospiraceae bacterium]